MTIRIAAPIFALLAVPLAAQQAPDAEKRLSVLEKQVKELGKGAPKDSGLSVRFGGRFHIDSVQWMDGQNKLTSGTFLRRARLSFKAGLGKDWTAEGDVDFAEGGVSIKDMVLAYTGFEKSQIQMGQFKQPFGFDTLSSSNATWLTERSYSDVWTPDRKIGIAYQKWGQRWQGKVSLFGQEIDDTSEAQATADAGGYKVVDNHGWGYAGRYSFAPVLLSERKAIHMGVAYVSRTPNADAPGVYAVDFSARPEANKISRAKFINAKVANVEEWNQLGAEFVGVWGPFSWQSEYQQTKVMRRGPQMLKWSGTALVATTPGEQTASTIDHSFSTWYGQMSWMWGGTRTYEVGEGLFSKVSPASRGALELILRYSVMDQDDLTLVDPIKGGIAKNLAIGLNYYLNKNIRFMLNHTRVEHNENAKASKSFSPTGIAIINDDFAFTALRMQVTF